jgi:cell wall-associated NlpC family hydrolase
LHEVGEDYVWGAEGTGGVAGNDDYDCSGFFWAMLNNVGVKLPRLTADGYRRRGERIKKPTRVGVDYAVFRRADGHATHIICYIGKGETVEAKGRAYGVIKSTVEGCNKRGAAWYRLPDLSLGSLTEANPAPIPRKYPGHIIGKWHKHHDEVRWIQKRLNARGHKVTVDGIFGRQTYAAVKAFRKTQFRRRPQGGNVGPKTWAALRD